MRELTPFILIIASVGLFFFYIDPRYELLKEIQVQHKAYSEASDTADKARQARLELEVKYNDISTESLTRLEKILPSNVDNVRLIVDLDGVASRYGIVMRNLKVEEQKTETVKATGTRTVINLPPSKPYESVKISFNFESSYDNFVAFLADLEQSLRVIDVREISIKEKATSGVHDFGLVLEAYWVKR